MQQAVRFEDIVSLFFDIMGPCSKIFLTGKYMADIKTGLGSKPITPDSDGTLEISESFSKAKKELTTRQKAAKWAKRIFKYFHNVALLSGVVGGIAGFSCSFNDGLTPTQAFYRVSRRTDGVLSEIPSAVRLVAVPVCKWPAIIGAFTGAYTARFTSGLMGRHENLHRYRGNPLNEPRF